MAVLIPGVVVGTAWLITRYAGERGATGGRTPRSADRWNWPTSAQAAGQSDDSPRTPHGRRVS